MAAARDEANKGKNWIGQLGGQQHANLFQNTSGYVQLAAPNGALTYSGNQLLGR